MKIIFFNSCKTWGGGEKWHYEMGTALISDNFQVEYFAQKESILYEKIKEMPIEVKAIKIKSWSFLNPFLILKLKKYFNQLKPVAIILNLPIDVKTAGIAAKLAGVPNIIYRRGSAIPIKNSVFNKYLFKKVITNIIANSNVTAQSILANNKHLFPEPKIKVIYNGINISEFKKVTEKTKSKDYFIIGNLARLSYQKGQKYLINLAKKLKDAGVKFKIIIGGEGELENELKQIVVEQKLTDLVVFTGFVSNIQEFLEPIDIFVFPSIWEGFGYSIVEAKMLKKPVVCFNISSNVEVVNNNQDGFLVEPFNEDELFEKVMLLINDIDLRHKMGFAGHEDVIKRFDRKRAVTELSEYLKNINS